MPPSKQCYISLSLGRVARHDLHRPSERAVCANAWIDSVELRWVAWVDSSRGQLGFNTTGFDAPHAFELPHHRKAVHYDRAWLSELGLVGEYAATDQGGAVIRARLTSTRRRRIHDNGGRRASLWVNWPTATGGRHRQPVTWSLRKSV